MLSVTQTEVVGSRKVGMMRSRLSTRQRDGRGGESLAVVGTDGRLDGQVSLLGRIGRDLVPPFASTTNDAVLDTKRTSALERS